MLAVLALLLSGCGVPVDEGRSLAHVRDESKEVREITSLCGPISLARVLAIHGKTIEFRVLLGEFDRRTKDGVPISQIVEVAKKNGLSSRIVRVQGRAIERVPSNSILLVDQRRHCLVLEQFDSKTRIANLWDPSGLIEVQMPENLLLAKWDGDAIVLTNKRLVIFEWTLIAVMLFLLCVALTIIIHRAWPKGC